MWTRAELKTRAKSNLRRYFGPAMFVSFIANLFSSKGSSGSSGGAVSGFNTGMGISGEVADELPIQGAEQFEEVLENLASGVPGAFDELMALIDPVVISVIASILVVAAVIGFVLSTFVAPSFLVGKNRYYMESRAIGLSAGIDKLIWGFKHNYLNIVWTMFLKNLIIGLGTLCFVVPGIYFSYSYYMVPYILAENPDMKSGDVLRMSKDMMDGHKLNTFVLELSFLGWWILGSLMCGVGGVLVRPYYDATLAELYAALRSPYDRYLNGFGEGNVYTGYNGNGGYAYDEQQKFTKRDETAGAGQEPTGPRDAEGGRNTDYGYHQGTESSSWGEAETVARETSEVVSNVEPQSAAYVESTTKAAESAPETKPSGEKVHGYFLNGVFYPYTEEELRELEANKHKN